MQQCWAVRTRMRLHQTLMLWRPPAYQLLYSSLLPVWATQRVQMRKFVNMLTMQVCVHQRLTSLQRQPRSAISQHNLMP